MSLVIVLLRAVLKSIGVIDEAEIDADRVNELSTSSRLIDSERLL